MGSLLNTVGKCVDNFVCVLLFAMLGMETK